LEDKLIADYTDVTDLIQLRKPQGRKGKKMKVQSSFAATSEDKSVRCKTAVSLRDCILILGRVKAPLQRIEHAEGATYKYMHIYLWSMLQLMFWGLGIDVFGG
jgi:hypothetical protein